MGNTNSTDMSFAELSAIGACAQQREIRGTSFIDLPPELREMIYDLCAPKREPSFYYLPLQSKPVVVGVSLLRCSKQIYNEVSRRLCIWNSAWKLRFRPSLELGTEVDLQRALSGLHDHALAKIRYLYVQSRMNKSTHATLGIYGLEVLLKLKSLGFVSMALILDSDAASVAIKSSSDLKNLPFITGFVLHMLPYIPTSVLNVCWCVIKSDSTFEDDDDILYKIAKQYKSLQGSAYTTEQSSGSSSKPIEISVSRHIWKHYRSLY
jgi:hypothetical protein